MWGAILNLLSGIVNIIPKVRNWGVTSAAAKKADADKRLIDDVIEHGLPHPGPDRAKRQR